MILKNNNKIILILLTLVFFPFSVFAKENKIENNSELYSFHISVFDIDYKNGLSMNLNNYYKLQISKKLNNNFDLFCYGSNNILGTDIKYFPFQKENAFFVKAGLGSELNRPQIAKIIEKVYPSSTQNKIIASDFQNIFFPFLSLGLGYDAIITDDVSLGTSLQYLFEQNIPNSEKISIGSRFLFNLSLIVKIK